MLKLVEARRIIPGRQVLILGLISDPEKSNFFKNSEILVPVSYFKEFYSLADTGDKLGLSGLKEIRLLREMKSKGLLKDVKLIEEFNVKTPLDLFKISKKYGARIVTSNFVEYLAIKSLDGDVEYVGPSIGFSEIFNYFTPDTMSVHLKEDAYPYAKRGVPGKFRLVKLSDKVLTRKEITKLALEIIESSKIDPDTFLVFFLIRIFKR